jgi:hypothetical protein
LAYAKQQDLQKTRILYDFGNNDLCGSYASWLCRVSFMGFKVEGKISIYYQVDKYLGIAPIVKKGHARKISVEEKKNTTRRIQIDDRKAYSPESKVSGRKAPEISQGRYEVERHTRFDAEEDHNLHNPAECQETIKIMALKMKRMEELLKLKEGKIQELSS